MRVTEPRPAIWNPEFTRVFVAAFAIEVAWALLVHLPRFLTRLGASEGDIGLLYAATSAAALLLRPLVGRILDTRGRKPVLLVAATLQSTLVGLYAAMGDFGLPVMAVRVMQGSAQVLLFTALLTYAADALPAERRTQGLALFGLSGLVPIGIGGVAGDLLIDLGGFTWLFLTAAGLAASGLVLIGTLPVLVSEATPDAPRRSVVAAAVQRDLIPVWLLGLTFTIAIETLLTFLATFVEAGGVGTVGLYFGVHSAMAVAVRLFASALPDRVGYRLVAIPSALAMVVTLLMLAAASGAVLFVAAAVTGGLGHGFLFPILSSQVVARARASERGTAMALFTSLFDVSVLAGMPVVGAVIDAVGYPTAFRTVAAAMGVGVVGFLLLDHPDRGR